MCRRSASIVWCAGVLLLPVRMAHAQTPPADPAPAAVPAPAAPPPDAEAKAEAPAFLRGTEIGGLVDAHYDWFSTRPEGDATYRNFDTRHDQFRVTMAQIWMAKTPTDRSRAGYKVKLSVGPGPTMVQSFEPGASAVLQTIEEGFISYLAPLGKGLQLDVGKFVTPHGAEVIEAKDNWNYSRSLLFALAIPYYHSGVRATYAPNDRVAFMGTIVNGWNNVVENNGGKTLGVQVALKPVPALSIVQNYMAGPEQPDNTSDWRKLSDTTVTYVVNPRFTVMGNYDHGSDTVAGARARWQGIAGYARLQVNDLVAIAPRLEWYDDPTGFTTGAVQRLKEATCTLELKPADSFSWRIEYRSDVSDSPVFKTRGGRLRKQQQSLAFGVLYALRYKG